MKRVSTLVAIVLGSLGAFAASSSAFAQADWPSRPIKFIVPWPPGGAADLIGRLIAERLSPALGQPVVVDNRAGAGGIVGTEAAARSAPDGYTMLFGSTGPNAINVSLYSKLPYDPVRDFTPVTQLTALPLVLIVSPSLPVNSVAELIALGKAKPGSLTVASVGAGTAQHLAGEIFRAQAGLEWVHVPYKGAGPAVQDIAAGNATMGIQDYASTAAMIQAGKLASQATTGPKRIPSYPDVKTCAEQGYPMDIAGWVAFMAPKGTPKPIVERVSREINKAIQTPEGTAKMLQYGLIATGTTPAEFGEIIRKDSPGWEDAFKASGITPE
ncbi:MAG: tripartite tricarboxylate transporter substrate binding protein [Burkholderiales bacterium]|nr:tripartite tricarboxylate transporter substrate binding protein [Burkholderiales bacterium]